MRLLYALIISLLLTACGIKGNLVLPPAAKAPPSQTQAPSSQTP